MKLLQPTAFLGNFVRFVGESANWPVLYKRSLVLQDEPLLIQYKVELNRFAVGVLFLLTLVFVLSLMRAEARSFLSDSLN